jgi:hypothetical protein
MKIRFNMLCMVIKNDGKQMGIRFSKDDVERLEEIKKRIIERSNGLADPDYSAIIRELAELRPQKYITDSDRAFVRKSWQHGPHLKKNA